MTDAAARLAAEFGAAAVDVCRLGAGPGAPTWPRLRPPDPEMAAAALRFAAQERWRVLPAGAATHLHRAPGARDADFVLGMQGLDRVLEYEPEEMVAVVQAGVALRAIEALAAPHAQRLGPDPAAAAGATVGGAVAANRTGPCRRSRGTWRDAVLGARVLHADGRSSKTGGKVVKNVTGFDLAKLYVGSCGTLVLFTEINLRLVPRPPSAGTLVAACGAAALQDRLTALAAAPVAPAAATVIQGRLPAAWHELLPPAPPAGVHLILRFEGRETVVRAQLEAARRVTGGEDVEPARGTALDAALREGCEPQGPETSIRVRALPAALPQLLALCREHFGSDCFAAGFVGVGDLLLQPGDVPAAKVAAWAAGLAAMGAWAHVEAGLDPGLPAGEPGDPLAGHLQREIRRALDPHGVFAPGAGPPVGDAP